MAREKASSLGDAYADRLEFEIKEIEKQGAGDYWIDVIVSDETYDKNPHGLLLPFLHNKTPVDPIKAGIDHEIMYQPDFPDIDVDFLPASRDHVKDYITQKYGEAYVCNVGLWQTFKPRSALNDAFRCHGVEEIRTEGGKQILAITKTLPDEFDDMDLDKAKEEYKEFAAFAELYPDVVEVAYSMVGCIRAQGKHAGGVIISSEPIRDHIPLTFIGSSGNKQWTAEWTEGMRSTQLSKFGFVKFDILGLINIQYIYEAGEMIRKNHGVALNWEDMDPEEDRAGWLTREGKEKVPILFSDEEAITLADEVLTDSIFQFNTRFQKGILKQGGVKSFDDLVVYNALGRPGPMPMIETYVQRRDGKAVWKDKDHPILQRILGKTHGVICYQEQLQQIWTSMAKLTVPEAEKARNQVKKKKKEDLMKLGPKVIKGLQEHIGEEKATQMWEVMTAFGRYAFNYSHSLAYAIISYRCLWLKAHYPSEWWAAVLSHTKEANRLTHLIGVAKREGVAFSRVDCNNLSKNFTAVRTKTDKGKRTTVVIPGVMGIKGIGDNAAKKLIHGKMTYTDLEHFIESCDTPNKSIMERLIKLGAFDELYPNRRALWFWYAFKKKDKKVVPVMKELFGLSEGEIQVKRDEQEAEYFRQYPKRKKVPNKIKNWKPKIDKSYEQIAEVIHGYSIKELLGIEKDFFGFYWTSPMDMFETIGLTIEKAKRKGNRKVECIISSIASAVSRQDNPYTKIRITDGVQTTIVNVWNSVVMDEEAYVKGAGVIMDVKWNAEYQSFVLVGEISALPKKAEFENATT